MTFHPQNDAKNPIQTRCKVLLSIAVGRQVHNMNPVPRQLPLMHPDFRACKGLNTSECSGLAINDLRWIKRAELLQLTSLFPRPDPFQVSVQIGSSRRAFSPWQRRTGDWVRYYRLRSWSKWCECSGDLETDVSDQRCFFQCKRISCPHATIN